MHLSTSNVSSDDARVATTANSMKSVSNMKTEAGGTASGVGGGGCSSISNRKQMGQEMAPLNSRARGDGTHGVTIVLTAAQRGSITDTNGGGGRSLDNDPNGAGVVGADGLDDPDRAAWSGKMQFFLSIIGYSVGLGNIWRFPYLCQQNGGGAFLIPFAIMLVLEGVPLFLIELGIGQRMRLGSLGVWNTIHPWLGGIGISSCIVTLFVALYYNVIITWCFFYLFNSFRVSSTFGFKSIIQIVIIRKSTHADSIRNMHYSGQFPMVPHLLHGLISTLLGHENAHFFNGSIYFIQVH